MARKPALLRAITTIRLSLAAVMHSTYRGPLSATMAQNQRLRAITNRTAVHAQNLAQKRSAAHRANSSDGLLLVCGYPE
jgi:hypothetical protein